MAAVDKQIFDLNIVSLAQLQSASQVGFVAQLDGYNLDFQVTPSILAQFLQTNYQPITVFGGSVNPDPAQGSKGDLYIQSNGKVYQKQNSTWILVTTLALSAPAPVSQVITGSNNPVVLSPPTGYYASRAYVMDQDGSIDWSRIKKSGSDYSVFTFGQDTTVVYI